MSEVDYVGDWRFLWMYLILYLKKWVINSLTFTKASDYRDTQEYNELPGIPMEAGCDFTKFAHIWFLRILVLV